MTHVPALEHPLLAPWYRLVEDGDRLLLEHGQEVVVLEGAAVRAFLPALLPLLDGSRSLDEIAHVLGEAARPAIENALAVLAAHGLLAAGSQPTETDPARAAALALAASHRVPLATVTDRARSARLIVIGGAPVGAEIARIARRAGLASVTRGSWEETSGQLVLVVPTASETRLLPEWNAHALAAGAVWLPILPFDGRLLPVGPLIVPFESACWTCLSLRRASNLDYRTDVDLIDSVPVKATADPGSEAVAAGLAASLALRWLLAHDTLLPGQLHAVEAAPLPRIAVHHVLRVPRCPSCSGVDVKAPPLPWHEARAA